MLDVLPVVSAEKIKTTKDVVTVRFYPGRCVEVAGHRYRFGTPITVHEGKAGWARNSEFIALRHYALTLLINEECKGIARGGRSAGGAGVLHIACSEDPNFLRQFPLEQQSW